MKGRLGREIFSGGRRIGYAAKYKAKPKLQIKSSLQNCFGVCDECGWKGRLCKGNMHLVGPRNSPWVDIWLGVPGALKPPQNQS